MPGVPELSDYQNVFRIAKNDAGAKGGNSRVVRRNRQPVSCLACRSRKLKCDRQIPCSSCQKRGPSDAATCNYSQSNRRDRLGHSGESKKAEAHLRLQKLEEMVAGLLQSANDNSDGSSKIEDSKNRGTDQRLESLSLGGFSRPEDPCLGIRGHLDVDDSGSRFFGATHWTAILENIRDIQVVLEPGSDELEEGLPSSSQAELDILFAANKPLALKDVFDTLGPKARVDKLLSIYFDHKHNQNPILHTKKFMREYESFWVDASTVSVLWISMLFSVLYIGAEVAKARADGEIDYSNRSPGTDFLTRAGQALVSGGYDKARQYSVESLILFAICNLLFKQDNKDTNTWLMMSVCARIALRMGYHQEPRHLGHFSSFEAEMRRRTFFTVEALDFLVSFKLGLPPVIPEEICDVEPPSNLFDTDFDEGCETLPPSRPPTDPTPMLYYCFKSRLGRISRRVYSLALAVKHPMFEQIMKLDADLQEIHRNVPPSLQMRPMVSCFGDQPYTILHRLNLDLMHQKILCILHRGYISYERQNPTYDYCRKTCIEAALRILKHQAEMDIACQPGGQLHHERWMPSNILLYDYLLAVMIICLDLYESRKTVTAKSREDQVAEVQKYDALKTSYEIWSAQGSGSRDANYASRVLAAMLAKVSRPSVPIVPLGTLVDIPTVSQDLTNGEFADDLTALDLDSPWTGHHFSMPDQDLPIDDFIPPDLRVPFNTIFESDNVDWEMIDQYISGPIYDGDVIDGL